MLYIIQHGYNGVAQRPQRDIVYVCCRLETVRALGQRIIFTDGHAADRASKPYEDPAGIEQLDWDAIRLRQWGNDEADHDRRRRKQAECLVQAQVPSTCISRLIVFDELRQKELVALTLQVGHQAEVLVNPRHNFYY